MAGIPRRSEQHYIYNHHHFFIRSHISIPAEKVYFAHYFVANSVGVG